MTEKEKAKAGLLYNPNIDKEISREIIKCKDLCHQYNQLLPSQYQNKEKLMRSILGKTGTTFFIASPFWCDYGYNIEIGDNFYANHNCVILDGARVKFGSYVFIGPNCCFATAGHPLDVEQRNEGLEYAHPISIGNNVWIGAGVTVLAGVTVGNNTVIGAGSLVNKDIPAGVIAVGNPCKVYAPQGQDAILKN
ncbi:sugar O-acetyltransferase [Acetobacterium sp.]|uniref:sugar O-acetyltransferase n=1 Tax=Acetobacterium sp. TaxID=1872094 RepID=UPI002F3FFCC3